MFNHDLAILSKLVEKKIYQEFDGNHYVHPKIKDQCYCEDNPEQISRCLPSLKRNLIQSLQAALLESLVAEMLQISKRVEFLRN